MRRVKKTKLTRDPKPSKLGTANHRQCTVFGDLKGATLSLIHSVGLLSYCQLPVLQRVVHLSLSQSPAVDRISIDCHFNDKPKLGRQFNELNKMVQSHFANAYVFNKFGKLLEQNLIKTTNK